MVQQSVTVVIELFISEVSESLLLVTTTDAALEVQIPATTQRHDSGTSATVAAVMRSCRTLRSSSAADQDSCSSVKEQRDSPLTLQIKSTDEDIIGEADVSFTVRSAGFCRRVLRLIVVASGGSGLFGQPITQSMTTGALEYL